MIFTRPPALLGLLVLLSGCVQSTAPAETADTGDAVVFGGAIRVEAGLPNSYAEEVRVTAEYQVAFNDYISTCMHSLGFEYFPSTVPAETRVAELGFALDSADYARDFGFGIAASFTTSLWMDVNDGNLKYLEELSKAAVDKYLVALDGPAALETQGPHDIVIEGCRGEAIGAVEQPPWFANFDWIIEVSEELASRMTADPRTVELLKQWAECMGLLGFDERTSEDELISELGREFATVVDQLIPTRPGSDKSEFLESLDESARVSLDEFQQREVELAQASNDCSRNIDPQLAEIARGHEKAILLLVPR